MSAISFFRSRTQHASSSTDASTPTASATSGKQAPASGGRKGLSFPFSLPLLTNRGPKSSAASAATSSMPPRSALKRKPLPENSLVKLMHAEQQTELTTAFLRHAEPEHARKSVGFAEQAKVVDGTGKLSRIASKRFSTHNVVVDSSPELRKSNTARRRDALFAAQNLSMLVKSHPAGTFDASIQQGIVPHEALEGADLGNVDPADVIHEFQELQKTENQSLLYEIANSLKALGATSADEAREILPGILQNTHVQHAHYHEADEILEEQASPAETLRAAFAKLPERLRGDDVIEMFESLGQPHPREVMNAKGEAYLDTIDERLAEINARGE